MPNAGKTNAVLVVAHPDDCVIFGYPFYATHKNFTWHICYLTYKPTDERAKEVAKFWNKRQVTTEFLGFLDDYRWPQRGQTGFDNTAAEQSIIQAVENYDLIVTHNADGDYGHLHHVFVHNAVQAINKPKIYFASTHNLNYQCVCQDNEYDLSEIPLHKSVVEGFHDRLIGRYIVTDQARKLLDV